MFNGERLISVAALEENCNPHQPGTSFKSKRWFGKAENMPVTTSEHLILGGISQTSLAKHVDCAPHN